MHYVYKTRILVNRDRPHALKKGIKEYLSNYLINARVRLNSAAFAS